MAELKEFTAIPISQEDIDSLIRAAGPNDDPTRILAQELSKEFTDNEGLSYEALSGGTSPYLQPLGRKFLNDEQIVQLLASNPDGTEIETGFSRVMTGAAREVVPSVGSIPGMAAGLKVGTTAQQAIPPYPHPLVIGAKAAIPLVGSLLGGIFGYEGTKAAQDAIIDEEGVILPEDKAAVFMGKTAVNIISPLSGLRIVTKPTAENFDIGAATYAKHLKDQREEAMAVRDLLATSGPVIPAVAGRRGAATGKELAKQVKIPKETNAVNRMSNFIEKSIRQAPEEKMDAAGAALITLQGAGGGAGAFVAQNLDPENGLLRFTGEMVGSTSSGFFPSLLKTVSNNRSVFRELYEKLRGTKQAQRAKGMRIIFEDLEASDSPADEVDRILRLLQHPNFEEILKGLGEGVSRDTTHLKNVVLRTGSPVLNSHQIALDNAASAGLAEKTTKQSQAFFDMYRDRIIALARTGDPVAVQVAADLMEANYKAGFQARLNNAVDARLNAIEQLKKDEPVTVTSSTFADNTELQMQQGRARERELYANIKDSELNVQALDSSGILTRTGDSDNPSVVDRLDKFLENYEDLPTGISTLATKDLNEAITYARDLRERLVGRIPAPDPETGITGPPVIDPEETIKLKELTKARSEILAETRRLAADPTKKDKARQMGDFADVLLDTMNELPFDEQVQSELKIARAFSRAFNDVFTRAFTGQVTKKTRLGDYQTAPELFHKKLFQGGSDALAVRLEDFDSMFKFLKDEGIDTTYETTAGVVLDSVTDSRDLMNRLLANYVLKNFDPVTGEIGARQINKFKEQFKFILDRDEFADVRTALDDSDSARQLLNSVKAEQLAEEKRLSELVTFQQLSSNATESPRTTINAAIGGSHKKPMESLKNILEVVNNPELTPEQQTDAMAGLQHAILDWAVDKAGAFTVKEGNVNAFKPSKMFELMFLPIPNSKSNQSLITVKTKPQENKRDPVEFEYGGWLLENGVMDEEMIDRIHTSLMKMVSYQAEVEAGDINNLMSEASGMMDLYLTMVGSAGATGLASRLGLRGGTGNIAIPARGAAYARDLYNKLPNQKLTKTMIDLFEDPDLFALHLRQAKDASEQGNILEQLTENIRNRFGVRFPRTAASVLTSDPEDVAVPVFDAVADPAVEALQEFTEDEETDPQASLQPVPQFMDRESRQLQGAGTPPTMSPPPAAPAPAPSGPVDRSQYAALFPTDITSSLIRAQDQGIGSLRS